MSDSVCVTVERESPHTALRSSSACRPSQTKREDDSSPRPGLARFFWGARRSRRACFRRERRASVPGLGGGGVGGTTVRSGAHTGRADSAALPRRAARSPKSLDRGAVNVSLPQHYKRNCKVSSAADIIQPEITTRWKLWADFRTHHRTRKHSAHKCREIICRAF
ncbi:hypothetical protein AOLI_G00276080 [Acnodon oligacanthus]